MNHNFVISKKLMLIEWHYLKKNSLYAVVDNPTTQAKWVRLPDRDANQAIF